MRNERDKKEEMFESFFKSGKEQELLITNREGLVMGKVAQVEKVVEVAELVDSIVKLKEEDDRLNRREQYRQGQIDGEEKRVNKKMDELREEIGKLKIDLWMNVVAADKEMKVLEGKRHRIKKQLKEAEIRGKRISVISKVPAPKAKPYKVLKVVQSMSSAGKTYEIRLGKDYRVYCTCPAWRYRGGNCKHLKQYREELVTA